MIGIRIEYLDSGSRPFGPFLRRLRLQYSANQVPQREPCAGPPRRRLVGRAGEAVAYTVPTVHRRRSDVTSLLNPAHFRTSKDTSSCTTSCVRSDPSPCGSTGMRNGKFNTTQYNLTSIRVVSDRRPRAQLRCRLINGARRARGRDKFSSVKVEITHLRCYVRVYLGGPTYVYGSCQKDPQFHDAFAFHISSAIDQQEILTLARVYVKSAQHDAS